METEKSIQERLDEAELQKKAVEIQKLKKELEFQSKPFRNPANIAPFATILVTLVTIGWAIFSGWLKNQSDTVQLRSERLAFEVSQFTLEKKALADTIQLLRSKVQALDTIAGSYIAQISLLDSLYEKEKRAGKEGDPATNTIRNRIRANDQKLDSALKKANIPVSGLSDADPA